MPNGQRSLVKVADPVPADRPSRDPGASISIDARQHTAAAHAPLEDEVAQPSGETLHERVVDVVALWDALLLRVDFCTIASVSIEVSGCGGSETFNPLLSVRGNHLCPIQVDSAHEHERVANGAVN